MDAKKFELSKKQRKTLRRFKSYLNGEWEPKAKKALTEEDTEMPDKSRASSSVKVSPSDRDAKDQHTCRLIWSQLLLKAIREYWKDNGFACDLLAKVESFAFPVRRSNSKVEAEYVKVGEQPLTVMSSPVCFLLAKLAKVGSATEVADSLRSAVLAKVRELQEHPTEILSDDNDAEQNLRSIIDVDSKLGYLNFLLPFSGPKERKGKKGKRKKNKKGGGEQNKYNKKTLTIEMQPSSFLEEEFELFCKYQHAVHNDDEADLNPESYRQFLVDTPIDYQDTSAAPASVRSPGSPPSSSSTFMPCEIPKFQAFGSFHQQYRIDGKLVAVGVIDLLINSLSSKYFFWDPEYAFLELGKISSLAEIDFVKQASLHEESLHYYYQGYYVHRCPKMAYKAEYTPAELLCPTSLKWLTFDDKLRQKMEDHEGDLACLCEGQAEFAAFFQDEQDRATTLVASKKVHDLKCMIHGQVLALRHLRDLIKTEDSAEIFKALESQSSLWMASCGDKTALEMVYQLT